MKYAQLVLLVLVLVFFIRFYFPAILYRNRIEININTKERSEIRSKLTMKTPENVKLTMKVNNKDTVDVVLVSLLLTLKFIQVGLYLEGLIFRILIELHILGHIFRSGEYIQGAY